MIRAHRNPVLAVDFDGVVHAYSQGWQGGAIYDQPVTGTTESLRQLSKRYDLVLFTARHDLPAVEQWLSVHRIRHLFTAITNRKPRAVAYLDDRAVRFTNWPDALKELL
jgi:hypothetical protein